MKKNIHPVYYTDAKVTCACGNTWTTGSIKKEIRTEVCSACHPFFTGQQQRMLDMEGQVDRFYRRLQARQEFLEEKKSREEAKTSPDRPLEDLELSKRSLDALAKAGLYKVADVLDKLTSGGDEAMLTIEGFGQKSLIDLKKKLRALGYEVAGKE
ncbi:MAG TPA: 50S ribosomal protein L31 [Flexilinea sp.]|jgi:large subunit ribosomal protein L31|nr:MAG: 50S ribosomal protein L31 [Chloroflexi bacterium ADurb.Bin344]HNY19131.1 50S ribosomal protein L31 [Flexilinea sp.]HOG21639.1 50S ribosomal protein L31 [Flexilinea sp.]HOR56172.1 50S ribosomal protein L31 [Flexilinea sp.]HOU19591.1 50S ribosomal protein L31 [Flexilinea sp.]